MNEPTTEQIRSGVVDPAELTEPGLRRALETWLAARRDRAMPRRADFDVAALGPYLADVTLLDVVDGGRDFRYRVQSTNAAALLGSDMTGQLLSGTDRPPDQIEIVLQFYRRAVVEKLPSYSLTPAPPYRAVSHTSRLVLPFSDDDRTVNMVMGVRHSGPYRRMPERYL